MAITAYNGVPGSGKSHAVVGDVILPAIAAGRRVITNVDGLKPDLVYDLAGKINKGAKVGEIVQFDGFDTMKPGFFPDPDKLDAAGDTRMKPGDLMVMDEVRLYWPARGVPKDAAEAVAWAQIMRFMRFHRHWVAEDGTSTDFVLVSQMMTDFHQDFRGLIERSLKFRKLNTIGLSGHYGWAMWEGCRQVKNEKVSEGRGKYRSEVSALYSSYNGGVAGLEKSTDKRASIWGSGKLKLIIIGVALMFGVAIWSLYSFFTGGSMSPATVAEAKAKQDIANGVVSSPPGVAGPAGGPSMPVRMGPPPVSQNWRIAGMLDLPGRRLVILADKSGVVRYEDASGFMFLDGRPQVGTVEGERVIASSAAVSQARPAENTMFGGVK